MQNKLRKSTTDIVLTGVCGGIGELFDISPPIVRTIFLFTVPVSFWIYVILAWSLEGHNSRL
ncbi:PspC domain-containing protein [Pseudogracilibacillus sp. SE30717A]|uniref:PspC domain-containing protein n=1 Tax=Pseudogracilibacillus sp. SE30717A TaxID=3098293 RepID=UPI00300DC6CF